MAGEARNGDYEPRLRYGRGRPTRPYVVRVRVFPMVKNTTSDGETLYHTSAPEPESESESECLDPQMSCEPRAAHGQASARGCCYSYITVPIVNFRRLAGSPSSQSSPSLPSSPISPISPSSPSSYRAHPAHPAHRGRKAQGSEALPRPRTYWCTWRHRELHGRASVVARPLPACRAAGGDVGAA